MRVFVFLLLFISFYFVRFVGPPPSVYSRSRAPHLLYFAFSCVRPTMPAFLYSLLALSSLQIFLLPPPPSSLLIYRSSYSRFSLSLCLAPSSTSVARLAHQHMFISWTESERENDWEKHVHCILISLVRVYWTMHVTQIQFFHWKKFKTLLKASLQL